MNSCFEHRSNIIAIHHREHNLVILDIHSHSASSVHWYESKIHNYVLAESLNSLMSNSKSLCTVDQIMNGCFEDGCCYWPVTVTANWYYCSANEWLFILAVLLAKYEYTIPPKQNIRYSPSDYCSWTVFYGWLKRCSHWGNTNPSSSVLFTSQKNC